MPGENPDDVFENMHMLTPENVRLGPLSSSGWRLTKQRLEADKAKAGG